PPFSDASQKRYDGELADDGRGEPEPGLAGWDVPDADGTVLSVHCRKRPTVGREAHTRVAVVARYYSQRTARHRVNEPHSSATEPQLPQLLRQPEPRRERRSLRREFDRQHPAIG